MIVPSIKEGPLVGTRQRVSDSPMFVEQALQGGAPSPLICNLYEEVEDGFI